MKRNAFTLIEVVIALGIMSTISVVSVYVLYLSLALRDLNIATTTVEDSLRVFSQYVRQAVLGANSITGDDTSLFITSSDKCHSLVYDSLSQSVRYSKISLEGCTPEINPTETFFSSNTKMSSLAFKVVSLPTGGRQVTVAGTMQIDLPFEQYQRNFSGTYINLVD